MACLQPGEPGSLEEAKQGPVWPKWEEAIKTELAALEKKETWELVDQPSNTNIIGSRWVFWLKHDAGGKITQHRARLVAQGYTQAFGINYDDTFSPIVKLASLRIIAALAARNDWSLQQMDVNSAYLNASLQELVYM